MWSLVQHFKAAHRMPCRCLRCDSDLTITETPDYLQSFHWFECSGNGCSFRFLRGLTPAQIDELVGRQHKPLDASMWWFLNQFLFPQKSFRPRGSPFHLAQGGHRWGRLFGTGPSTGEYSGAASYADFIAVHGLRFLEAAEERFREETGYADIESLQPFANRVTIVEMVHMYLADRIARQGWFDSPAMRLQKTTQAQRADALQAIIKTLALHEHTPQKAQACRQLWPLVNVSVETLPKIWLRLNESPGALIKRLHQTDDDQPQYQHASERGAWPPLQSRTDACSRPQARALGPGGPSTMGAPMIGDHFAAHSPRSQTQTPTWTPGGRLLLGSVSAPMSGSVVDARPQPQAKNQAPGYSEAVGTPMSSHEGPAQAQELMEQLSLWDMMDAEKDPQGRVVDSRGAESPVGDRSERE